MQFEKWGGGLLREAFRGKGEQIVQVGGGKVRWKEKGSVLENVSEHLSNCRTYIKERNMPFQDMCWGNSKKTVNGTRNVVYFMTTGLGPVRATRRKRKI